MHMNSTVWHTLTGFVHYLSESGKCRIDETEKGWHIQLIDQEEELRKQKLQHRAKQEKSDEDRLNELLQRQMERAMENANEEFNRQLEGEELVRNEDDEKIVFNLKKAEVKEELKPTKIELSSALDVKPSVSHKSSSSRSGRFPAVLSRPVQARPRSAPLWSDSRRRRSSSRRSGTARTTGCTRASW